MVEEIEMVVCMVSMLEIPKSEAVFLSDGKYVSKDNEDEVEQCIECEHYFVRKEMYGIDNGYTSFVCGGCKDNHYITCNDCDAIVHVDDVTYINDEPICEDCRNNGDYFCCEDCGEWYHVDDQHEYHEEYYCGGCYDNIDFDDDDNDSESKDGVIESHSNQIPDLPKQEEYQAPQEVLYWLNNFYNMSRASFKLYKRRDIKDAGFVTADTGAALKRFKDYKDYIRDRIFTGGVHKYESCEPISCEGVNVTYTYIDMFGCKKERIESIMSIYKYFATKFPTFAKDYDEPDKKHYVKTGFDLVLSNDLNHKIKLADANDCVFSSCQNKSNRTGYARGMHDWFANGCNVPIMISYGGQLVGRLLVRLMIDDNNKEYMFMDRLYLSSNYSQSREMLYQEILKWLMKKYDVAVPIQSQHDSPVYDYVRKLPLIVESATSSLRQPYRYMNNIHRGYYHDSYTKTREKNSEVYDRIDKHGYVIYNKLLDS